MKKIASFVLLTVAFVLTPTAVLAQSPQVETVRIEVPDLGPERAVEREVTGQLTVLVDGVQCGVLDLNRAGDVSLEISTGAADASCLKPGAEISFVNQHGQPLFERYKVEPGLRIVLTNLAPEPPSENGIQPPSAGTEGLLAHESTDNSFVTWGLIALVGGIGLMAVWARRRTN